MRTRVTVTVGFGILTVNLAGPASRQKVTVQVTVPCRSFNFSRSLNVKPAELA